MKEFMVDRKNKGWKADWKNIWLGVTVCNQAEADEKIPILLQIPAAVRWISVEPLIDSVDLNVEWGQGVGELALESGLIKWVVLGGETGPGARPMNPDWAISARDECQTGGVPFFFKGWGEWFPLIAADEASQYPHTTMHEWQDGIRSVRVGRKAAGRFLDGREWNELPEVK